MVLLSSFLPSVAGLDSDNSILCGAFIANVAITIVVVVVAMVVFFLVRN